MKKREPRSLLGLGFALFGFMLIVLSAIDYAVGLSVETTGFTGIGIACFAMGLYLAANRSKQR
ncbi:MAG: hypothetical protein JW878_05040 [Methanomicrobia archaeon]|nr:hypothetical protein [Methanomicrobia archaeon]